MMSNLFCQKWIELEPNFVEYFECQWLRPLANWFDGAAEYTPSTNNALESHNATIKRRITMQKRLPLNQFFTAMKQLTEYISIQFSDGSREIATKPHVKSAMMNEGAIMYQNRFKCFKAKSLIDDIAIVLVPSKNCPESNANEKYYGSLA